MYDYMVCAESNTVCVPPQFNAEAESHEDCLTCFCFEHTSDCYSSNLFVSQASRFAIENWPVITIITTTSLSYGENGNFDPCKI